MRNDFRVEEVEAAAAAWLLKRDSPQWSAADGAALAAWLEASTNHRVAFARLGSVWREVDRMKIVRPGFPAGQAPPQGAIRQSPFFARQGALQPDAAEGTVGATRLLRSFARRHALAASMLLGLTLALGVYLWPSNAPTYRTPLGGLATVPMDDGSKITLNTASEIALAITDRERRVDLARGEAFFEVAKDPARPFVVYANDQRIVAVGTSFSVRLESETVRVAVMEGRVRLENRPARLSLPFGAERERSTPKAPLLIAGTVADASAGTVSLQQQPLSDLEQSLSWRTGHVVLRRAWLSDAVAEFNRYNRRQLVIADASLREIRVGGNFQSSNIDGFVRLLEEGFQIHAEERDGRITLSRR